MPVPMPAHKERGTAAKGARLVLLLPLRLRYSSSAPFGLGARWLARSQASLFCSGVLWRGVARLSLALSSRHRPVRQAERAGVRLRHVRVVDP